MLGLGFAWRVWFDSGLHSRGMHKFWIMPIHESWQGMFIQHARSQGVRLAISFGHCLFGLDLAIGAVDIPAPILIVAIGSHHAG